MPSNQKTPWKRVFNENKAAQKTRRFMKKKQDTLYVKLIVFIFFPVLIGVTSFILIRNEAFIAGLLIWMFLPLTMFLLMGSFLRRVLNSLPMVIMFIYIIFGLETGLWQEGTMLFFIVPFGSLVLKPKKSPVQYLTLSISILVLTLNFFTTQSIAIYLRWGLIVLIYIIFLPPALGKKIEAYALKKRSV